MLFPKNKTKEINKMTNFVLAVARFCGQMTIQKEIWFSQVKIIEKTEKKKYEEIKTFSLQIIFLTLSKEEENKLKISDLKNHSKIYGEIVLKKGKDKFSLKKIDIVTKENHEDQNISSFSYFEEETSIEGAKYSFWMNQKQKDDFANFISYFAEFA